MYFYHWSGPLWSLSSSPGSSLSALHAFPLVVALVTQGGLKYYECHIFCVIKVANHRILWGMFLSSVGLPIHPVLLSHQDAFLGKKEMAISRITSV